MKHLSILHRTDDYRGDHCADVQIAIEPIPGETIEQLIERLRPTETDCIELRVIRPAPSHDTETP